MNNIFDKLKNYSDSDYYAFHMPGHKRNLDLMDGTSPYRIDITEIDGFDDLHHAEGILSKSLPGGRDTFSGEWKYGWNHKCNIRNN